MAKIEGRKYEVELEDGRTVSRQYYHYLLNKERYKERRRKRYERDASFREKAKKYQQEWHRKFKEDNGMSYYEKRKNDISQ